MDEQLSPDQVKQFVLRTVQQSGVPKETFIQLGQLAEQVINKQIPYQQFVDQAISMGAMSPNEISQDIDYQMITSMIAIGRVCQEMNQPAMGAA